MDLNSPELRWANAIWLWRDTGDLEGIANQIRNGEPILEKYRELVADIFLGRAVRGVKPNHKSSRYKIGLMIRRNQSIYIKAAIICAREKHNRRKQRCISINEEVAQELILHYGLVLRSFGVSVTEKTVRYDTQGRTKEIRQLASDLTADEAKEIAQDSLFNNRQN